MTDEALDFDSGWVVVPHAKIYWEASGNPRGVPVLYLHGGPGGSLGKGGYRGWHDRDRYWTIGLDQRGCGKSTPTAQDDLEHLSHNTTQVLICDIEAVREHLGIVQWIVTGISWGSTLALAYSLAHPHRVSGIAVVAVTTTSRDEVDWISEGMERIFPEAWQEFSAASGAIAGERLVEAYARRLAGADREDARLAAEAWDQWESWHVSLDSPELRGAYIADERRRMTFALLVTHYWSNDGFLSNGQQILGCISELDRIPGHLIHGRRDVSGPAITPWRLHQRWRGSKLTIVEGEGHVGARSLKALVAAVEDIASEL